MAFDRLQVTPASRKTAAPLLSRSGWEFPTASFSKASFSKA